MSRGLISYRRLVGSCSKMARDGSIIVEICDETMAKMSRKPVEMQSFFACMLFFFGFFSGTLIFGECFFLRLLSYGNGDPSKPHLNLQGKHFLLLFCVICPCLSENCVPKIDLTIAIFSTLGDCFVLGRLCYEGSFLFLFLTTIDRCFKDGIVAQAWLQTEYCYFSAINFD